MTWNSKAQLESVVLKRISPINLRLWTRWFLTHFSVAWMGWAEKMCKWPGGVSTSPTTQASSTSRQCQRHECQKPDQKKRDFFRRTYKKVHNVFHALVMILSIKFGTMVEIVWLLCAEIKIASERFHHDEELSWREESLSSPPSS